MKFLKFFLVGLFLVFVSAGLVYAAPTEKHTKVVWSMPTVAPDLAGFYLYVVAQSSPQPYAFTDDQRFQIADPAARETIIVDLGFEASGGICFALTSFDTSLNESDYANVESGSNACGWFGMTGPIDIGVR